MVTVVIPAHNGGRHLRQCLASLAQQDAAPGEFDVVVLDNCSTDGSLDHLRILPDRIGRRVIRSERFLPIEANWLRILSLDNIGEFITILGHDDTLEPPFIRLVHHTLRSEPDVRLLLSHFRLIDQNNQLIRPCRPMAERESADGFLAGRLAAIRDSFGTGYVTRFDDYRSAGGIPQYPKLIYADDVLWLTLARPAGIRILRECCFSYRLHPSSVSQNQTVDEMLAAVSQYLSFIEELAARDSGVRRVFESYGPGYIGSVVDDWMYREAVRATVANEIARPEVMKAWEAVQGRVLAFTGGGQAVFERSSHLSFALWANDSPLRRRLWRLRETRGMMRALFRATNRPPATDVQAGEPSVIG